MNIEVTPSPWGLRGPGFQICLFFSSDVGGQISIHIYPAW